MKMRYIRFPQFILSIFIPIILFQSCESTSVSFKISDEPQLIIEDYFVSSLEFDKDDNLWFGTKEHLYKFDNKVVEYNASNSTLPDSISIGEIESDSEGNLWFLSDFGLLKYSKSNFTVFDTTIIPPEENVYNIKIDQNNCLWICSNDRIAKIENDMITNYDAENFGAQYLYSKAMTLDSQNNLWFCYGNSLYKINDQEIQSFENDDIFYCQNLAIDNTGNIWLTCDYSISSIAYIDDLPKLIIYSNAGNWKAKNPDIMRERFFPLKMIVDSRGIIWISSLSDLYYFDGDNWDFIEIGLPVSDISEDKNGDIWLGTTNGIYRLKVQE